MAVNEGQVAEAQAAQEVRDTLAGLNELEREHRAEGERIEKRYLIHHGDGLDGKGDDA
jgi:hypothetical protein